VYLLGFVIEVMLKRLFKFLIFAVSGSILGFGLGWLGRCAGGT